MRPVWARTLSSRRPAGRTADTPWEFRAGEAFGYADLEGNLYYVGQTLHNLSLSDRGFMNYGSVPDHVVFMNPHGEFEFSFKSPGYPLLEESGQVLYSINTDRSGLKRIDIEGESLWSMSFPTLITSISLNAEECLVGLMDGRALLMGSKGEVIYQYDPDDSRIPVVLATALSADRGRLALISGIDPQTLTVIERHSGEFAPVTALKLDSDFRREVRLDFSPDSRFLFYEQVEGLGILEVRRNSGGRLQASGVLESVDFGPAYGAASFRTTAGSNLLIFRPMDAVLLRREVAVDPLYLKIIDRSLILGVEGVLLRADLLEG